MSDTTHARNREGGATRKMERPERAKPSRRQILGFAGLLLSSGALPKFQEFLKESGWNATVYAANGDPVREALSGLVAFVVPGPDAYSAAQGLTTPEPGGIDANILDTLIQSLDLTLPAPPPFPNFSSLVAGVLNQVAQGVNPAADGFAKLSFGEKVQVFGFMETTPQLAPFVIILSLVSLLAYSEAGVYDPATRTLTGTPVGWTLTGYEGVADGRDEFKGYYQNRRKADQGSDRAMAIAAGRGKNA